MFKNKKVKQPLFVDRLTTRAFWGRTLAAAATTLTSSSTAAPVPTSAEKRRPSSRASRESRGNQGETLDQLDNTRIRAIPLRPKFISAQNREGGHAPQFSGTKTGVSTGKIGHYTFVLHHEMFLYLEQT